MALALGVSSFFMLPIVGDIKPFDLICLAFALLKIRDGFTFRRSDTLYFVFIGCAVASLASAKFLIEASALQTARYLIFFLVARLAFDEQEHSALRRGLIWSVSANLIWIVIDLVQYYSVGECTSINETVFPWVEQIVTHRYPLEIAGCLVLRPTGFTWDPGGLFPIMLVTTYALGAPRLVALASIFSLVAVSRTAIITAVTIFVAKRSLVLGWGMVLLALFVVPAAVLLNLNAFSLELEDGTLRHLTYPGLAVVGVLDNLRYLVLGDGLRAGATMFITRDEYFIADFFTMDELVSGDARHLVVESIWVNLLTGAGVLGFSAYAIWMWWGLRRHAVAFLGLLIAGTYYTFDSSVYCFLVAYLMTAPSPRLRAQVGRRGPPIPDGLTATC